MIIIPRAKESALLDEELSKLFKSGTSFSFSINLVPVAKKRSSSVISGNKLSEINWTASLFASAILPWDGSLSTSEHEFLFSLSTINPKKIN